MKSSAQDSSGRTPSNVEAVVKGNTRFALALYQHLRAEGGSLFFSPYSVSCALAMTYAGARRNTGAQMAQALHFPLGPEQLHPAFAWLETKLSDIGKKGQVQLRFANALWPHVDYPFLQAFLDLIKRYYGAPITAVDYRDTEQARRTINAWVEEKTANKIQELVPTGVLDALTRLVLVNASYFKGSWASQFDPDLTRTAPFWVTPDEAVQVPLMTQSHEFGYAEEDGLQVLEVPYAGDDLSMVVLLPREIDGLVALEERLTAKNLGRWTKKLRKIEVQVFLPRFEITFPFQLDDILKSMGMVDAFGDESDFSGMDGTNRLYIGAVLHQAFVSVNEEGTEAAAATGIAMQWRSAPLSRPVFCADHPFVFLIQENRTGSIPFLGRVKHPLR